MFLVSLYSPSHMDPLKYSGKILVEIKFPPLALWKECFNFPSARPAVAWSDLVHDPGGCKVWLPGGGQ